LHCLQISIFLSIARQAHHLSAILKMTRA
jgi:hypothetical protein